MTNKNILLISRLQEKVQNLTLQCPVFDLVRNIEFSGSYQTVSKRGAITVPRELFKEWNAFFVVLVVKPNDYDCYGVDKISPDVRNRKKAVTLKVVPSISGKGNCGVVDEVFLHVLGKLRHETFHDHISSYRDLISHGLTFLGHCCILSHLT